MTILYYFEAQQNQSSFSVISDISLIVEYNMILGDIMIELALYFGDSSCYL